jgi:integrase
MRIRGIGHVYLPTYQTKAGETRHAGVYWWKLGSRRCSTGHRTEDGAQRWVVERLHEMQRGHLVGAHAAPLKWDDLERMLEDRWAADDRRGMAQCRSNLKRLRQAFAGWPADAITSDQITRYAVRRRQTGAAAATVNLELAILRRAFTLARESGRLNFIPLVHRLPGVHHRTGTVEPGDLEAILALLPERYRPVIRFLWLTGWRESEALGLTWSRVDLDAHEVRLDTSKSGQPRVLHHGALPGLVQLLADQHAGMRSLSPFVFAGRGGRPIDRTALQKAWRRAAIEAGVPNALIHDLRRTMVRDLRRAGVPLAVAMGTVGHASLQVHQGYSIVSRDDQTDGLARLEALRSGEPIQRRFAQFTPKP